MQAVLGTDAASRLQHGTASDTNGDKAALHEFFLELAEFMWPSQEINPLKQKHSCESTLIKASDEHRFGPRSAGAAILAWSTPGVVS